MGQKKDNLLQERPVTSESEHEGQRQTNAATSNQLESGNETWGKACQRYRDRTSRLQREVRNLRKRVLRAPEQCYHAVEAAVARTTGKLGGHSDVWKIKHPSERIKNWIHELTCRLIAVHRLPATQTPGMVSKIMWAIRANTGDNDETDSSKKPFSRGWRSRPIRSKVRVLGQFPSASETISTSPGEVEGGNAKTQEVESLKRRE